MTDGGTTVTTLSFEGDYGAATFHVSGDNITVTLPSVAATLSSGTVVSGTEEVAAGAAVQRAVRNGLHEVQVYRFPNVLCTDRGRAINQMEPGWENTLTGMPKEIFHLWKDYLQPRGYKIAYQIIDFPAGCPEISVLR